MVIKSFASKVSPGLIYRWVITIMVLMGGCDAFGPSFEEEQQACEGKRCNDPCSIPGHTEFPRLCYDPVGDGTSLTCVMPGLIGPGKPADCPDSCTLAGAQEGDECTATCAFDTNFDAPECPTGQCNADSTCTVAEPDDV